MVMDYKVALGATSLPRAQFLSRLDLARKCAAAASLPPQLWEPAARSIARALVQHTCVLQPVDACASVADVKEAILELRARGAGPERIQEAMARIKVLHAAAAAAAAASAAAAAAAMQQHDGP